MKKLKCSSCQTDLPFDLGNKPVKCLFCGKVAKEQTSKVPCSFDKSNQGYSVANPPLTKGTKIKVQLAMVILFLFWFFLADGYFSKGDMRADYLKITRANGKVTSSSSITGVSYYKLAPVEEACDDFIDRYEESYFETDEMLTMSKSALNICSNIEMKIKSSYETKRNSNSLASSRNKND